MNESTKLYLFSVGLGLLAFQSTHFEGSAMLAAASLFFLAMGSVAKAIEKSKS